jgi:hypothetical protein
MANKHDPSPPSGFKKTLSVGMNKFLSPMAATTGSRLTHGLASDLFNSKKVQNEAGLGSNFNPFKNRGNMQELLI